MNIFNLPTIILIADIAWTVYDKYFFKQSNFFCIQGETKYIFQVFVENKSKNQKRWIMALNKQLTFVDFTVAISFKLRVVNTYLAYWERYFKVFYVEMIK